MCARAKQTRRIGWIGLGTMGLPMALRLADKSGCAVHGCDIVPAAMDAFASMGGIPEPDGAALLENSDVVFLSLPGNALVQETLTDAVRRCRRGTAVVDTSSSLPAVIQSCAAQAAARGVELIDCPVSGRRGSGGRGTAERHVRRQRDGSGACFPPAGMLCRPRDPHGVARQRLCRQADQQPDRRRGDHPDCRGARPRAKGPGWTWRGCWRRSPAAPRPAPFCL